MDRPTINTLEETSEIQTILSEHGLSAYIAVRDGNLKAWSALTTIKKYKVHLSLRRQFLYTVFAKCETKMLHQIFYTELDLVGPLCQT